MLTNTNSPENHSLIHSFAPAQNGIPAAQYTQLLSLLINNTDESFILLNEDFNVILFNNPANNFIQTYLYKELYNGFNFLELVTPERKSDITYALKLAFAGQRQELDSPPLFHNNEPIYLSVCYKPLFAADETVLAVLVVSKNITAEKTLLQTMKSSEERWRFALEGSNHGLWDWDLESNQLFFSDSFKQMYGFEKGEALQHYNDWYQRLHPEDRERMKDAIEEHLKSSNPYYESTYRIQSKGGSYKWILARGMVVEKSGEGKPLRMIGTHTDISVQKKAEETYRLLFYDHPISMFAYELESGIIKEANSAALVMYGYSKTDFLKLKLTDLRQKKNGSTPQQVVKGLQKDTAKSQPFVRHYKCDGIAFFADTKESEIILNETSLTLISVIDVTEKVTTEEQLKASEKHYRLLFGSNPSPSWIYDSKSLQILEVNKAAIEFYGFKKEEFLTKTVLDLQGDKIQSHANKTGNKKTAQTARGSKQKHYKKDGTEIWIQLKGNPFNYYGTTACLDVIHDITEQVKTDAFLKESNKRFELAAKAASEALWEWDIANDKVFISPVYKEMFGHDINLNSKYEEWHQLIHPEDREATHAGFYKAIGDTAKDHWEQEYRYLKADGSFMFVHDQCIILRNSLGVALKAVGTIQNITKRKQAELELKKSNERFKLVTKATSDAIYEWNLVTNELVWGEGLTTLFNYTPGEVNIEQFKNLIHKDDFGRLQQSISFTILNTRKKFWKEEYRFQKKDGTYRHVIDKAFIVRDAAGEALKLIGAMQDLTEIKLQEKELIESNNRYKYASLATSEIIWDWNIKKGTILWSDNFTKVLGWLLPENKTLPDVFCLQNFHPDDRDRVWASLNNAITSKTNTHFQEEFRYKKKDGTYACVTDRGYVLRDENGDAYRMIGAIRDISNLKYNTQLLELERKTFELSTKQEIPLAALVNSLLSGLEELHTGMVTSVLLLQKDGSIQHLAAPSLPEDFKKELDGIKLGPLDGSCGTAMHQRKMITVSDTFTDPLFQNFRALFNKYNLRSAWSVPIIAGSGSVIGSLAMYSKTINTPDEEEITTIERAKNLLRILLENYYSLQQLQTANQRFDSVLRATHDLIWDWDIARGTFYRDYRGMQKVYGVACNEKIKTLKNWLHRIHPEDYKAVKKIIFATVETAGQEVFELEYRFKRDDGDYNYVYDRGIVIKDKNGKPVRMIGAAQDITDRKKLEQQLVHRELEKQRLIGQATIETQEQERTEIGKELHDNVNQVLTTTKLYLDLSVSNADLKDELIQKSSKNIIYVINEIRQLSRSLMSPSLGDLGLVDSINDLIENINLTRKLYVELIATEDLETLLNEGQKLTIFRIVQEALNNAMKHAKATSVQLYLSTENQLFHLHITDDGVGFDPLSVKKGSGLKNIQNRVYLSNGNLSLQSSPGTGCHIEITFPINI